MLVYVFPISVYGKDRPYQTFLGMLFALAFPVQTAKSLDFPYSAAGAGFLSDVPVVLFPGVYQCI